MQSSQRPDMSEIRRQRHDAERHGRRLPGMRRSNPFLVAFLGVFVFLPATLFLALYLDGVLTGDWRPWGFLLLAVGKIFGG